MPLMNFQRIIAAFAFAVVLPAADFRLGIIGTDTSHVTAFTAVFNDPKHPEHVPGVRIVAAYKGGSPDVYVCDANGGNLKQLTATREDESSPCWSPDGQWICFAAKIKERRSLCKVAVSGGPAQRISTAGVANPSEPGGLASGALAALT